MMTLQGLIRSPKGAALLGMGASSALHFSAYEFSRSAIIALFTSEKTGFSSDGAMPIAIGCIGPFSLVLLWVRTVCPFEHVCCACGFVCVRCARLPPEYTLFLFGLPPTHFGWWMSCLFELLCHLTDWLVTRRCTRIFWKRKDPE